MVWVIDRVPKGVISLILKNNVNYFNVEAAITLVGDGDDGLDILFLSFQ